jgi:hypothetical protein
VERFGKDYARTMTEEKNNRNDISHHILPAASNLLGICFVILSFMKVTKAGLETIIDEMVAISIVLFLAASILSYASIRAQKKGERYEKAADIIFLSGLSLLAITAVIIALEII